MQEIIVYAVGVAVAVYVVVRIVRALHGSKSSCSGCENKKCEFRNGGPLKS